MSTFDLEIIVPVYNEGKIIEKVYQRLNKALSADFKWRALFIYDFKEDVTVPHLERLAASDSRVVPMMQTYGRGVVRALRFGFDQVGEGAVAVVMGDDSDDVESLRTMHAAYKNGATVVASSRYSEGGSYKGGSWIKKQLSRLAGRILFLCGIGTQDPTNNFKLYSGRFLKEMTIESSGGFEVALELTVKAAGRGLKVSEIPGGWKDREEGQSKFKLIQWLPHYLKWFFHYFKLRFIHLFVSAPDHTSSHDRASE